MARTSACNGLFPTVKDPTAATPDAPIGLYETGGARSGLCYFSTEIAVDAAVIGGKERWARRLDGLQNQFKQELEEYAKEEPDSPRVEAVRRRGPTIRWFLPAPSCTRE